VPVIREGRTVVFETEEDSQVIAKYLDDRLQLGLFPVELEGIQSILWRYIEREIEDVGFRLNDIYWKEFVPPGDRLRFLRHKERKFGRGCLERWRLARQSLLRDLQDRLLSLDEMLIGNRYLLGPRPHFVDFDLYGMLENFLYSGHYTLPAAHRRLRAWHRRMGRVTFDSPASEKLRP
jgi:glutathione S-transferase